MTKSKDGTAEERFRYQAEKKLAAGDEGPKQICSYDAIFKKCTKKENIFLKSSSFFLCYVLQIQITNFSFVLILQTDPSPKYFHNVF